MIVLGIDTSTNTGGAALVTEDALIGEYVLNVETNHSDPYYYLPSNGCWLMLK